jgi:hypothetical protein
VQRKAVPLAVSLAVAVAVAVGQLTAPLRVAAGQVPMGSDS